MGQNWFIYYLSVQPGLGGIILESGGSMKDLCESIQELGETLEILLC